MRKKYSKEEIEHEKFLGKPLPGLNELVEWLPQDQICLLEKYGAWMEALIRQEIKPFTEDQKNFVKVVIENKPVENSFEKAWTNAAYVRKRNQTELIARERQLSTRKRNQTELIARERQLSVRAKNFSGFPNPESMQNNYIKPSGGVGFFAGICLAILAFSIVPVIPVIIAFFAGHWVRHNAERL